jgi:hypothetical protein
MAPIDRELIQKTLALHARAYRLLLQLGDAARAEPELLSPANEELLSDARTCTTWLTAHRDLFTPGALDGDVAGLAGLLSSFFHTSFHVERFEWQGRIVQAELRTGAGHEGVRAAKRRRHRGSPTAEALLRLCREAGLSVHSRELASLGKEQALRRDLHVWCYAVGLVQRSLGRAEGEYDWEHWRSLPLEERKSLDADRVWEARERLVARMAAKQGH